MKVPEKVRAKPGQRVLPAWEALIAFIEKTGIIRESPELRVKVTSNGTHVWAPSQYQAWQHPFRVTVSGTSAAVQEGEVNGVAPGIAGVRVSGVDSEGRGVVVPPLPIEAPASGRESFVALRLALSDLSSIQVIDDPERVSIVHRTTLSRDTGGGVIEDRGVAYQPLAKLVWNRSSGTVERVFQIVHHNLGHRYVAGDSSAGTTARHFFWAV